MRVSMINLYMQWVAIKCTQKYMNHKYDDEGQHVGCVEEQIGETHIEKPNIALTD